jgi:hypothetical protein
MRVSQSVKLTIDSFERGELDGAVLHACNAWDGTSKKRYPGTAGNRERMVRFLREVYWLIEPMAMPGVNLDGTKFENVPLPKTPSPDFAEVVDAVHRCAHGHGDELPAGFELLPSVRRGFGIFELGEGVLRLPDYLPFALIGAAILSPENVDQRDDASYYFSLGSERFSIDDWWGRESDFRPIAERYRGTRVKLEGLGTSWGTSPR